VIFKRFRQFAGIYIAQNAMKFIANAFLRIRAWHGLASLLLLVSAASWAQQAVPALTGRVVDMAQILTAGEAGSIDTQLARIEQARGSQIVVLLVNTVAPEDISSYANRVANAWKIGRKDVGDGVLLIIAKEDRKLSIEVAKSLEGAIPDLAAKQIINSALVPALKQGKYADGIEAAIAQLDARIAGENLPAPASTTGGFDPRQFGFEWQDFLFFLLFAVPIGGAIAKSIFGNKLGALLTGGAVGGIAFVVTASMVLAGIAGVVVLIFTLMSGFGRSVAGRRGRGHDGGGWSGGGSSGGSWGGSGGGGGFSSGGGGDFGGGGASGDW
jgi:uncharacterized protein